MKLAEIEKSMGNAVEATKRAFNTIRTGRANAALLDKVMVDYYGAQTPLNQMSNISTPDASTLMIQPYDPSIIGAIEKAIMISDLGLNPNSDGSVVRLNIPPLTSERRKEFVKLASKYTEEGKVSIRNVRRDGIDAIRKLEKSGDMSKDEARDMQDEVQKLTDKYTALVDEAFADKEKDILKV
ncbi:MAG: ribosome recycling factor [Cyanobacteria bacterium P01_A01_bin.123]